ncbi:MAG TPA: hypothetical protein VFL63_03030, partial [Rhodanobacteraceae bacterium]|nr:hypothetical protein [Rhodanobacteraceae bacterium]
DPKQQYFSDGLSEELISDLTQIDGLKVIGKYSSFKFRDSKDSPAQIGVALGVANLVEGSVQQNAGRIRIVVNLIRAKDGASVWSHTYDKPLKDVFAIQSQIGKAVASALQVKLLGNAIVDETKPPSGNVEAYRLMLQGRAVERRATNAAEFNQSVALLRKAVELDPNYAYAWGALSNTQINLGSLYLTGDAQQKAYAEARAAADREFTLAPDAMATHVNRGYVLSWLDGDQTGALAQYRRALTLAPHDGFAMQSLANQYGILGQLQQAVDMFHKAIATDPLRPDWYYHLSFPLVAQGHLDQAEQAAHKALTLQPDFPGLYSQLSEINILRGDAAAALRNADKETDPDSKALALALAKQIGGNVREADAALKDYIAKYGKTQPYNVADLYALRKQPDEMFQWLDRARKQNKAGVANNLLTDPLLLRYKHDPRFAALCKQLGLPAPGQPLPAAVASTP